jgi:hypothetical protein
MPVPTAYTEDELKTFMHGCLKEAASVLGWTVAAGSYDDAVTETLVKYGASDIASAVDIRKLRTLARVAVWQAVVGAVSLDVSYNADGGQYSLSHMFEHASKMLQAAEAEALPYDANYAVQQDTVTAQDPYRYQTGDEYAHRPGTPIGGE